MTYFMDYVFEKKSKISFKDATLSLEDIEDMYAEEGIVKAAIGNFVDEVVGAGTEIKGWFEGIKSKKEHLNKIADKTIEWLEDKKYDNPKMSLDMGRIKTWLKTSDFYHWRFYFLLNDSIYNDIVKALKKGELSIIEDLIDVDMPERRKVTRYLESARTIDDLIIAVEKYKARANNIFDLLLKRDLPTKGFPFQVMLLGMTDLKITVKNIVNLVGII